MEMQIIDASVAVKWFLPEENERERAFEVLEGIKQNPSFYAVPDLFYCEMIHVLCKIFDDAEVIIGYLSFLQDLGMTLMPMDSDTSSLAVTIVKKHGLSGYDSIYAANAKLVEGIWLTADKKAHQKISSLNISKCL